LRPVSRYVAIPFAFNANHLRASETQNHHSGAGNRLSPGSHQQTLGSGAVKNLTVSPHSRRHDLFFADHPARDFARPVFADADVDRRLVVRRKLSAKSHYAPVRHRLSMVGSSIFSHHHHQALPVVLTFSTYFSTSSSKSRRCRSAY
jgi:hypothetical protein